MSRALIRRPASFPMTKEECDEHRELMAALPLVESTPGYRLSPPTRLKLAEVIRKHDVANPERVDIHEVRFRADLNAYEVEYFAVGGE